MASTNGTKIASLSGSLSLLERVGVKAATPTSGAQQGERPSPRPSHKGRGSQTKRRGVGLIELLIALSISAALLTATGVAIDASFKSYAINQTQAGAMQSARLAMYRLTTAIRQNKEHSPLTAGKAAQFAGGLIVTDSGIEMYNANDQLIKYTYDAPSKEFRVIDNGTTHVLLSGVETFQIKFEPIRSAESIKTGGSYDLLLRASIKITVRTEDEGSDISQGVTAQAVTISGAVMPRRNAW